MGKSLTGQELGSGIYQRKDGRYEVKVSFMGVAISFYEKDFSAVQPHLQHEKEKVIQKYKISFDP